MNQYILSFIVGMGIIVISAWTANLGDKSAIR